MLPSVIGGPGGVFGLGCHWRDLPLPAQSFFRPSHQVVIVVSDTQHRRLGFLVTHIAREPAHFLGALAPVLGIIDERRRHRIKPRALSSPGRAGRCLLAIVIENKQADGRGQVCILPGPVYFQNKVNDRNVLSGRNFVERVPECIF
jgi:hypothetical protein